MEKVAIISTATIYGVKRLIDDLGTAMSTMGESRDRINKGFNNMIKYQDSLAVESGGIDVNGSEILDINAGGVIMSVTRDTLTQIKGTMLEALFSGQ